MGGRTIPDRGASKEVLKEKGIFAQTLDRLADHQHVAFVSRQSHEIIYLDHQVIHCH